MLRPYTSLAIRRPPPQRCGHAREIRCAAARCGARLGKRRSPGRLAGEGPAGRLPLTPDMLREQPSGNVFGLTQNVGMGWSPASLGGPQYVIVSTHGGLRSEDGSAVALGYHTGHWEIGLLVRAAAEALRKIGRAHV